MMSYYIFSLYVSFIYYNFHLHRVSVASVHWSKRCLRGRAVAKILILRSKSPQHILLHTPHLRSFGPDTRNKVSTMFCLFKLVILKMSVLDDLATPIVTVQTLIELFVINTTKEHLVCLFTV